jgi:hypothetical protein
VSQCHSKFLGCTVIISLKVLLRIINLNNLYLTSGVGKLDINMEKTSDVPTNETYDVKFHIMRTVLSKDIGLY